MVLSSNEAPLPGPRSLYAHPGRIPSGLILGRPRLFSHQPPQTTLGAGLIRIIKKCPRNTKIRAVEQLPMGQTFRMRWADQQFLLNPEQPVAVHQFPVPSPNRYV